MLSEVLSEDTVLPDLDADSMDVVMEALLEMLCRTGKISDPEQARQDLEANTRRMSVGMDHGIAIPHARTDSVQELIACVAVTRQEMDIESVDGRPARIFIMTLSPRDATGPHIQFLSEIGKRLKHRSNRQAALEARSPSELLHVFTG